MMKLPPLDLAIVAAYLALTIFIGFWISKRASTGMRSYFLGGNQLPWYALGLSNASGMFDVAGTMWLVSILFVYGLKSIWLPWLWPVFNQVFLMVFLSIWLRRSGVMTGAEWIIFRFGDGRSARLSHLSIVLFALILVLAYMAYGFLGIGKLTAQFVPFNLADYFHLQVFLPEHLRLPNLDAAGLNERTRLLADYNDRAYGVIIIALTAVYVIKGGMYSVVFTEVMQFIVMTITCLAIAWVAMAHTDAKSIMQAIPDGWSNPFFGWNLELDWAKLLPSANEKIASEGYSLFTIFFMLVLFKGILTSLAGPAPNYDMQRVLSARSPTDAAKMSGFVSLVLNPPRYLMIAGLTVLALVHFSDELRAMGKGADYEAILPFTLGEFLPTGLLGLTLAGLLAAFMSSFAAPLNAAPAYIVNDIYKKYINPEASEKKLVGLSYLVSIAFVVIGTGFGLFLHSIDSALNWITAGLYGGYTAANVVKWYWWRMNGWGYFWGMVAGIIFALILGIPALNLNPLQAFPFFFAICLACVVSASLLTPATEMAVLERFYIKTRPWGFWGPVQKSLQDRGAGVAPNTSFKIDAFNIIVGIIWQTSLVAAPIFFVTQNWTAFGACAALAGVTTLILKIYWWDRLEDYPKDYKGEASDDHIRILKADH
ncbi:sodium:solute symporter family protein [Candidatus Phycosocius spiralis]|uniref:Sodium:solute symporter n=1 Tax=Candidatus Phycosocius spiralis TaxID=2815099 RepID=A0ABQ4PXK5_9PROT|nr:sodium:solute symporter family protein [Candidatus Phycosocius spiralis]GIU67796.1 sodium:solute symporter [Candidatus Phycosocius spiralis]